MMTPDALKDARAKLRLSQKELAKEMGVQTNTVARWEQGVAKIPRMATKLVTKMLEESGSSKAVLDRSAVHRDSFHKAILDGLGHHLDPEVFEACAADLIGKWFPVVPLRGGSDQGFDGAVATGRAAPFPLVCTTGAKPKDNLTASLKQAISKGRQPTEAIFATSRRITSTTQAELQEIAESLGVTLVQCYSQDWFANQLYREPDWAKRLLGLSGRPRALSPIPLSDRPPLVDRVLGREEELDRLRNITGDALVVGEPGSGKTFALQALATEGRAFFLVDNDRETIANDLRQLQPAVVIVDDAHICLDTLANLRQIRSSISAAFNIFAVTWPAEVASIRAALDVTETNTVGLPLLDADLMVEVVKASGIKGPNQLIRLIVQQAAGRPGLAVFLAHLCMNGEHKRVVTGDALVEALTPRLTSLMGHDPSQILACFALAGETGCSPAIVAEFLKKPLDELTRTLAHLAAAGVIRSGADHRISVWPTWLRWALTKKVFFDEDARIDYEPLFARLPDSEEATLTLLAARAQGARITKLDALLKQINSPKLWAAYAGLGKQEALSVIKAFPKLAVTAAQELLHYCPSDAIAALLDIAVGDNRELHSHPEHPLRKIKSWALTTQMSEEESIKRRDYLLAETTKWWEKHIASKEAAKVAARALAIAFTSEREGVESDPGRGNTITISQGTVGRKEIKHLRSRWSELWPNTCRIFENSWPEIFSVMHDWHYGPHLAEAPNDIRQARRQFARTIADDIARSTRDHPGVQHRISMFCSKAGFRVRTVIDTTFQILFPLENLKDLFQQESTTKASIQRLAKTWSEAAPETVATVIIQCEQEANDAGITYPRLTGSACDELAKLVENPIVWVKSLVDRLAPPDLVEPFIRRALQLEREPVHKLLECLLESDTYRGVAIGVVLTIEDIPEVLLNKAMQVAHGYELTIETACLRGIVPWSTLSRLLASEDIEIALPAAIGHWNSDHSDKKWLTNYPDWQSAIIRSTLRFDYNQSTSYRLVEILSRNSALAEKWLIAFVNNGVDEYTYESIRVAKKVIPKLDKEQRNNILNNVTPGYLAGRLIKLLISDDFELFEDLLNNESLKDYHLEPLRGAPESSWRKKVILAIENGHSAEAVVDATLPNSWHFSGPESVYWQGWKDEFEKYVEDQNKDIALIAQEACQRLIGVIDRCKSQEKLEDVYGH